jgi:hypothetical protein
MQNLQLIGVTMAAWAFVATSSQAADSGSRVLPPNSNAFGKSLAEWLRASNVSPGQIEDHVLLDFQRTTENVTGSGTIADPLVFWQTAKVTLKPGTAFVSGPIQYSATAPEPVIPDDYWGFGSYTFGEVVLDGRTVMSEEDCGDYYVSPQMFDPVLSSGVYEAQGFIFACKPLSVGAHALHMRGTVLLPAGNVFVGSEFGAVFDLTVTITVAP